MVDLTFNILQNKYKLTSDERQYVLQRVTIATNPLSKNLGEEVYSSSKYFRSIPDVFSHIARTYPSSCEEVISSLAGLEEVQRNVKGCCEDVMATLVTEQGESL